MNVTSVRGPEIVLRLSVDEADQVLRHLDDPNAQLPRAITAQTFRDQLHQAITELTTRTATR